IAALRENLGLTLPLWHQYGDWIGGVLRGDLGTSLITGVSVGAELADKAQVTVPLAAMSLTVALVVGLPFGVLSALRRGRADGTALSVG
ncbi:ABC transporter permease, partial [Staphylococcus aureus]